MIYNINLYPGANGNTNPDVYIEHLAMKLYDEYVCDFRLQPEDVKRLVDIAVRIRQHRLGTQSKT